MTANNQVAEASVNYLAEAAGHAVPVGYKQTEIGLIPVDWEVYRLGDRASFIGSGKTNTKSIGEYPLYGSTGLIGSCKNPEYEGEAILVARVGANAGKLNFVSGEYGVSDNTILVKLKPENSIQYYKYWLIRKNLNNLVFGSGQPLITGTQIKELLLPLPPENEQTAIANALSDVDALINELEKLITKKQAIKTATMQQLLTGCTRLPPFALREDGTQKGYKQSELGEIPEDWGVKTIGQLFTITAGGDLRKNEYSNDQTEVYQYPIFSNAINKKGLYGYCSTYDYYGNYLTITARGGIGHAVARTSEFCVIGRLLVLNPSASITCKFFEEFINQYLEFANESTGVPQLTAPQVAKYSVMVPGEEEQSTIATMLSEMDTDIQTLQQRLSKTRQIKQGMMQQLLTGKIRLIKPEPSLSTSDRKEYAHE